MNTASPVREVMSVRGGQWRRMTAKARIMSFVERTDDGHWLWRGSRCGLFREYGQSSLHGQRMTAHRAVWKVLGRPLPDDLDLLHQCDQTLCVNPDHLCPGTHAENLRQAVAARGGQHWALRGEAHPRAKLTQEQVDAIRRRHAAGERPTKLASEYPVSQAAIRQIVRGHRWRTSPDITSVSGSSPRRPGEAVA